jgi:uncharacterized SAM-binding protein YcdF (DUF218 family)
MFFILSKLVERFLVPSNIVLGIGALGILLLIIKWRRLGITFSVMSILLLGIGGLTPFGNIALATLEDRFPIPSVTAPPTGIIVLGGAVDIHISPERGEVTLNDAAERITETAALAVRYPQARIFLSGGAGHIVSTGLLTESALCC